MAGVVWSGGGAHFALEGGVGVPVRHRHLHQRGPVQHGAPAVRHVVQHEALAVVEAHAEAPALPRDDVARHREARPLGLQDVEGLEVLAEGGLQVRVGGELGAVVVDGLLGDGGDGLLRGGGGQGQGRRAGGEARGDTLPPPPCAGVRKGGGTTVRQARACVRRAAPEECNGNMNRGCKSHQTKQPGGGGGCWGLDANYPPPPPLTIPRAPEGGGGWKGR